MATDGADYLVAWTDGRSTTDSRILAARVTRDGDILDRTGIVVNREPAAAPKAIWTGGTYLITWTAGPDRANVRFATVDRDGNVSGQRVLAEDAVLMAVGRARETTMIVYQDRGTNLRAALLDRDARVITHVGLTLTSATRGDVTVASNGSECLIAWYIPTGGQISDLEVLRVAIDGTVIGTPRNLGPGYGPRLASDGTDYVLVARRYHSGEYTWSSRALAADLSEVSPPVPLPQATNMDQPSLLWNGSEYVFFAQQYPLTEGVPYRLSGIRIGRNGRPIDDAEEIEQIDVRGGSAPGASVATNGNTILAAWVESSLIEGAGRDTRVVARRYSATTFDGLGNGLLLTVSGNRQMSPAVAFDANSTALVIWRETQGLYFTRLAADGRTLDGRGIQLSPNVVWSAPKVVFDGIQFVAAWIENGNLEIRFLTPFGDVRSDTLHIDNVTSFALKNGFKGAMLAWTDESYRLWATRLDRNTRLADPAPVAISPEGEKAAQPDLSWNGRETLVVWSEIREIWAHGIYTEYLSIKGARLSAAFTVIDTAPITVGDVADAEDAQPSISTNGEEWLVTWLSGTTNLRANRVLRNGTAGEGTLLATNVTAAEVQFDGSRYALAFKRERELYTAWLPATGSLVFSYVVSLGNTQSLQQDLSITRNGASTVIAYARVSEAPEHAGVERAFIRYVEPARKVRSVR